jgi:uncharacterized protein YoxC
VLISYCINTLIPMFFLPDNISKTPTFQNIVIVVLCLLLAFSLVAIYRIINHGSLLEGMTSTSSLDPTVAMLRTQTDDIQNMYNKLKDGINSQKNLINGNSQMLLKTTSEAASQSNNVTHANINSDDPSKTRIPNVNTS